MIGDKAIWEKAVDFHGHACPGLALGYRAAQAGMRELKAGRSPDEELFVIVENDNCSVDAVQVVTGCTMGKGNLYYRDYGKNAYTFGRRDTGEAVRIVVKGPGAVLGEEFQVLRRKVMAGDATGEERERFRAMQADAPGRILNAPEEDVLTVKHIKLEPPPRARIFASVTCAVCGEQVMEPRARLRDGRPVCIPCSEPYPSRLCDR